MDFKEFYKLTEHPDAYSTEDVAELRLLSEEELQKYQTEIELHGGDNLSDWEHLLAFFTLKKKLMDIQEAQKNTHTVEIKPRGKRMIVGNNFLGGYRCIVDPEKVSMITVEGIRSYTVHLQGDVRTTIEGNVEDLINELNWDVEDIHNKIDLKKPEGIEE